MDYELMMNGNVRIGINIWKRMILLIKFDVDKLAFLPLLTQNYLTDNFDRII